MPTPAYDRLHIRLDDARRLVEIHEECTGRGAGRRHGYDALNRSTVILAVAAWEGFIEDLANIAVDRIVRYMADPAQLPSNVRDAAVSYLHDAEDWATLSKTSKASIWGLAGEGWRTAYVTYARARTRALNTPNYMNLRKLYSSVLGVADLSARWSKGRWTAQDYIGRLDALLALRHQIAHGAIGSETVGKTKARAAVALVERLAGWTDRTVVLQLLDMDVRAPRKGKRKIKKKR